MSITVCTYEGRISINMWYGTAPAAGEHAVMSGLNVASIVVIAFLIVLDVLIIVYTRDVIFLYFVNVLSFLGIVAIVIAAICRIAMDGWSTTFDFTIGCTGPLIEVRRANQTMYLLFAYLWVLLILFVVVRIMSCYYPLLVRSGCCCMRLKWTVTEFSHVLLAVPIVATKTNVRDQKVGSTAGLGAEFMMSKVDRMRHKLDDLKGQMRAKRREKKGSNSAGAIRSFASCVEGGRSASDHEEEDPSQTSEEVEHNDDDDDRGGDTLSENDGVAVLQYQSAFEVKNCYQVRAVKRDPLYMKFMDLLVKTKKTRKAKKGHMAWYVGEVDGDGKPHGFGRWKEESTHGEELLGVWHHGVPHAPFKSREWGSGSGFIGVCLGWASFGRDNSLIWGVGKVECSVSGVFFRDLPEVETCSCPTYSTATLTSRQPGSESGATDLTLKPRQRWWRCCCPRRLVEELEQNEVDLDEPLEENVDDGFKAKREKLYKMLLWRNAEWVATELRRHGQYPSFGREPCTNLILGVDRERGLYVSGHVPSNYISILRRFTSNLSLESGVVARPSPSEHLSLPAISRAGTRYDNWPSVKINVVSAARDTAIDPSEMLCGGDHMADANAVLGYQGPELTVEGWVQAEQAGHPEGFIFCHGYNCVLVHTLAALGQMSAFAHFPTYIKSFVFNWPCGLGVATFFDARRWAMSEKTSKAFILFITSLRRLGIRQFHIMAHSMGSRMLLFALKRAFKKHPYLFETCESKAQPEEADLAQKRNTIQILTLTLMNPEYFLDDFIDEFPMLRRHCAHITIFADSQDGALWWSEVFSRRPALGRSAFGMRGSARGSRCGQMCQPPNTQNRATFGWKPKPFASPLGGEKKKEEEEGGAVAQSFVASEADESTSRRGRRMHNKAKRRKDATNQTPGDSLSYYFNVPDEENHHWLDVDVIDTSFMDQNIGGMRHMFFNLNREVIDDLRELVLQRKRAFQRTSRLDRREGNVWVYRVAPSFLKSLYD
eukprot:GHVS01005002.1.p1 GENE.GHVS01005002.1~~GHVS01005002.1.p1  ORF type:complete len:1134 (-),score=178.85 GHVS01005002.1:997-3987(-)